MNLLPYRQNKARLEIRKERIFSGLILILAGSLIFGFLINLSLKNLAQEKKLIFLNQQEKIVKNNLDQELNSLNKEQQDWAAQGLKLDLLLNYSRESADWGVFLKNLPGLVPNSIVLKNFDFNLNSGLKITGIFNKNFSQDLEVFLNNLKKESLWGSVEMIEAQGAEFLIQAKQDGF